MRRYRGIETAIICAILTMSIMITLPLNSARQAEADTLTGWYDQQSGVEEILRGISAVDASTAWVVGDSGTILKTTDGGTTWTSQASGTTEDLYAVSAVDKNTAWAVGLTGIILKTTNGGAVWTPQTSGTDDWLDGISAVDTNTAWAVGEEGIILKTTNGGATWTPQIAATSNTLKGVCAIDANTAWAVCGDIFKTSDGGITWKPQEEAVVVGMRAITAVNAQNAWAVGNSAYIINTKDGGDNWTLQDSGTYGYLHGVSAVDVNTVWAVGDLGGMTDHNRVLLKTSDGGITWQSQAQGYETNLYGVAAIDANTAWAVGADGTIIRTSGGGEEYVCYFAEGYTGEDFHEYLCLGNPHDEAVQVLISYMFADGVTQEQRIEVPPLSRATIDVNSQVGEGKEVSAKVISDREMVAERPMYFNYQGRWPGGHNCLGASNPDYYWYFAEGYTGPGFEEYICILNPDDREAYLTFTFQTQEEGEKVIDDLIVPPHTRSTFKANDLLGGAAYQNSLALHATPRVVAERATYFDYTGLGDHHWTGGHCVMGINDLCDEYYFAEGTTRPGFEEWLTLQNPYPDPTTVTATYQLGPGQGNPIEKTYELSGDSRLTIYVPHEVGEGKDVSIKLKGAYRFLAERPTYFSYDFEGLSAQGGHCVIGATSPASEWFFAEGCTLPGFQQWLCLQNSGDTDATVEITYFTQEEGALPARTEVVPANTRKTIMVNDHAGSGYQISTRVKVTSGPDIVAERPMYFICNGRSGGHDVVGYTPY